MLEQQEELVIKFEDQDTLPGKLVTPSKHKGGASQYRLIIDSTQAGVEEKYFWLLRYLLKEAPFGRSYQRSGKVIKTKDVYTAGETSSYWGSIEQRRAAQIDKFQQIMGNIGTMLKSLFQLLRELRVMDERLGYYKQSYQRDRNAEVALKSIWVDMVEGGAKNPGSVTGLASQVGFVTLPDFFYMVHPRDVDSVQSELNNLHRGSINRKVKEVLGRKLYQYLTWKEKTYRELNIGREFKLKYMIQHYQVIRLYLNWLRPYLRNIKRLQMKGNVMEKDIIAAFETSKVELEFLAIKMKYEKETLYGNKEPMEFHDFFPCVRVSVNFVAIPEMSYQQDFQRGAVHRGRSEIHIEAFITTEKEIKKYLKKLEESDLELLSSVDSSIEALKDDLNYYLVEGGAIKEEKVTKK